MSVCFVEGQNSDRVTYSNLLIWWILVGMSFLFLGPLVSLQGSDPASALIPCPVTDKPAKKNHFLPYRGGKSYFSSSNSRDKFQSQPFSYST